MFRKPFEVAGARFEIVDKANTPWKSRTIWRNVNYQGGEEVVIAGSSRRFEYLMERLVEEQHPILRYISEVCLIYWINPTTGLSGSSEGYLKGDKEVLGRLIKKSYLKWVDKAQGISTSALEIDEEVLRSLK